MEEYLVGSFVINGIKNNVTAVFDDDGTAWEVTIGFARPIVTHDPKCPIPEFWTGSVEEMMEAVKQNGNTTFEIEDGYEVVDDAIVMK
jgi:hypothetical protein